MEIKILGPGCAKCRALEDKVRQALAELGLEADVRKITDLEAISEYVMLTPGLVINGEVKLSGRLAGTADIKRWIREASQG